MLFTIYWIKVIKFLAWLRFEIFVIRQFVFFIFIACVVRSIQTALQWWYDKNTFASIDCDAKSNSRWFYDTWNNWFCKKKTKGSYHQLYSEWKLLNWLKTGLNLFDTYKWCKLYEEIIFMNIFDSILIDLYIVAYHISN